MSSTTNAQLPYAAPLPQSANTASVSIEQQPWGAWFAWHPVKLYMTRRFCWLRTIHRRCVVKNGLTSCEYTDQPEEYPGTTPSPGGSAGQKQ